MPLLAIAYPNISTNDVTWIENLRNAHDELYSKVVAPHFTLVFPVTMEPSQFITHVKQQSRQFPAFRFVLKCAVIVKDSFNEYTHVFLVPDEGYSNFVKLHDILYRGPLEAELRLDLPFIPHLGIGNSTSAQSCKELADQINLEEFAIQGSIENLDVVLYENNTVTIVEQIALPRTR